MPKIKVKGQTVQPGRHGQTNGQTGRWMLPILFSPFFALVTWSIINRYSYALKYSKVVHV